MKDKARQFNRIIAGRQAQDGDAVQLIRVIGHAGLLMVDPFLLLDQFSSNEPVDYVGGFPEHPHRGFQTITYLLAGRMRHKDSAGHESVIGPGGVQYMNAGSGVVHSEMPEQRDGRLAGFQLWLNLPKTHKMDAPAYQQYDADEMPLERRLGGENLRVIMGETSMGTHGPIQDDITKVLYCDVHIAAGQKFEESLSSGFKGFIYVHDGVVTSSSGEQVSEGQLGELSNSETISLQAGEVGACFILASPLMNRSPALARS